MSPLHIIQFLVIGLVAGFVGTLLGIGGGSIVSPVLIALGVQPHQAVSASLTAVVGTGLGGLPDFLRRRLVRIRLALTLEALSMMGAVVGGLVAIKLPGRVIVAAIAAALATAGTITILHERFRFRRRNLAAALAGSFTAGMVSAITGIGGGVIKVPLLLTVLSLGLRETLATSKLMVLITATTGLTVYVVQGVYRLELALPLAVGSYVGATLGARLVIGLEKRKLKMIAATLYYVMSILTLARMMAS